MNRLATLALLALATASSAISLPDLSYFDRQVVPGDAIGRFRLSSVSGVSCPRIIEHNETASTENLFIAHSAMEMNNRPCPDGEVMTVYLGENAGARVKRDVMRRAGGTDGVADIKRLVDDITASGIQVIYGVELDGRVCSGNKINRFTNGTIIVLFTPETDATIGSASYISGRRYMIVDDPRSRGNCIYTAPLIPDPTPGPTDLPSASVTPVPSTRPPRPGRSRGPTPSATPVEGDGDGDGDGATTEPSPDGTPENTDGVSGAGTATASPSASDPDGDDGSVCFPAHATVQLEDGSVKTMDQIELGDRVKVAKDTYSDVYMFTHKDATIKHSFVQISTESGKSLTATRGHYIYINGNFAAAMTAKVGDVLQLGNGANTIVNRVSIISSVGLFNPQTIHGDIIVDSIRASTFTQTIEPATAQTMLAPFRMLYGAFGWTASFLDNGADQIAAVLPRGQLAL